MDSLTLSKIVSGFTIPTSAIPEEDNSYQDNTEFNREVRISGTRMGKLPNISTIRIPKPTKEDLPRILEMVKSIEENLSLITIPSIRQIELSKVNDKIIQMNLGGTLVLLDLSDPSKSLALKAICSILKIPFNFCHKNPIDIIETILNYWHIEVANKSNNSFPVHIIIRQVKGIDLPILHNIIPAQTRELS